jgi:pSer/pThr/pTyr-binding forkhead associated (FHA) protein
VKSAAFFVDKALMTEITAYLKPLTPEAQISLGAPLYRISRYPLRVGRESRSAANSFFSNSRRRPDSSPNNDLYLKDAGKLLHISREHFQIERRNGSFFLVDRNSMCGTIVEGETVGKGRNGGERQLQNGDVIIVGTSDSRQIIKFITQINAE